jgi:hypothetical protein
MSLVQGSEREATDEELVLWQLVAVQHGKSAGLLGQQVASLRPLGFPSSAEASSTRAAPDGLPELIAYGWLRRRLTMLAAGRQAQEGQLAVVARHSHALRLQTLQLGPREGLPRHRRGNAAGPPRLLE